ncbi:hypothetical protein WR25_08433 [Diploscapter pachys]|uniref:Endoplasmic reticulum vesicle transporter C-terminal domain-containing protein n=1 Tax=Diploscapter pachys TaxID=2018661 RepID=A0A2A2K9C3_9BILA|nr:hypothetical protein WR25_08433 [Diploscapter pachys]
MVLDIKRFDIYRKVPKDLTQPTTTGAIISIVCVLFISIMIFNDILGYLHIELKNELYVDDPGREGRIDVRINVTFPFMKCEYLGVDIQDNNGRHEVGFEKQTQKHPLGESGCRFESEFMINKVPGNFHISTHSANQQPQAYDMRHEIHEIHFGDDHSMISHSGTVAPAIWFKYELQPITVKITETRQPFYLFITWICAVVGGTFTVAGIIDSTFFTLSEMLKKHQLGKLS